jgi:hypothetical protein
MRVDDIHRYLLPIAPIALLIPYQQLVTHKLFKPAFILFLIAVYIYTYDLLPQRMVHYGDYAHLRMVTSK